MEKRVINLLSSVKKIDKKSHKKLSKVENHEEIVESASYLIGAHFNNLHDNLIKEIELIKNEKDTFFAEAKLMMILGKIKLAQTGIYEDEMEKLQKLFNEAKSEVKNAKPLQSV